MYTLIHLEYQKDQLKLLENLTNSLKTVKINRQAYTTIMNTIKCNSITSQLSAVLKKSIENEE